MAAAANTTIAPAKKVPRLKPKRMLATMTPKATKLPITSTPRRKEKSMRVVTTTPVNPRKSQPVIMAAMGMTSGEL